MKLLIIGGIAALAFVLLAGKATYPRWGMHLRQSENR